MRWTVLLAVTSFAVCWGQTSFPISTEDRAARPVYDVIIVGAGLTGLSAARKVLQQSPNATVLLLEARGQVGGRIRAISMATAMGDDWVDLGAQFISRDHTALLEMAQSVRVKMGQQANCGQRSLLLQGVRRRRRDISWSSNLSVRPSFRDVVISPSASQLGSQTVGQFVTQTNQTAADAASINRLLQTLFDAPENTVSALQVALTTASENATVAEMLLNNGHGNSLLAEGGMFKMAQAMADGLDIRYNERVVGINQMSSPVSVLTSSSSLLARQVIVAVPPVVASGLVVSPPLEPQFQNFLSSYRPTGSAFYFTMTYATAFWRSANQNGQAIFTSGTGPVAWLTTFDLTTSKYCVSSMGTTGVLWGVAHFVNPSSITEDQRHNQYIEIVAKTLSTQLVPLDVKDVQFSSDPLALGTIGVMGPNSDLASLQYLRGINEHGNCLVYASAEFSNVSLGLMNGAVLSGQQAAQTVLQRIRTPTPVLRNDISSPVLFDAPLQDSRSDAPFAYSTSTHYPPTSPLPLAIQIILAPASFTLAENSTAFPYSTSSHYPPTENVIVGNSVQQRDQPLGASPQSSTSFPYQTSSHYPSSGSVETTTYTHFSMGNAGSTREPSSSFEMNQLSEDAAIESYSSQSDDTATTFGYRTSSHYPSTGNVETTTYKHFSRGNLEDVETVDEQEPPANMILGPGFATTKSPPVDTATNFVYRTSSHYPPSQSVETTTYTHFSMGNADGNGQSASSPQLNIIQQDQSQAPNPPSSVAVVGAGSSAVATSVIDPQIVSDLKQISDQASSSTQLRLATQLSSIVQRLLESLQRMSR